MKRSTNRILTTHTGSLARPKDLLDLMKLKESRQPYDAERLAERVARAVAEVVRKQAECGIDVVNDGEQSKTGFYSYIRDRLTGIEPLENPSTPALPFGREQELFPEYYAEYANLGYFTTRIADSRPLTCSGPITYQRHAIDTDLANLTAALRGVPAEEAFVPATAPSLQMRNAYYTTQEEFVYAVAEAIREEYRAIIDAGFLLQIDGPGLPHPLEGDPVEGNPVKDRDMRIEALNYALRGFPEERIRFHACCGINHGPRVCDVSLADMIRPMLRIKAQSYLFEAANPRHLHEYHVFEDVKLPEGKIIVPGMVTHAHNIVEHPALIAEMTVRYATLVGRENVMIGNDCGFSSQAVYKPEVDARVAWAKFQSLAEGARLASNVLWPERRASA
jgi:5-methyltetrahydropteroyltriglutamate--homocysteine methyltransferase